MPRTIAKNSSVGAKKRKTAKKVPATDTTTDWKKKTVAELKQECTSRGLSTTGKKDDLIQRLQDEDEGDEMDEPLPKLKRQASAGTKKAMEAFSKIKKEDKATRMAKPDFHCPLNNVEVYEDYDCMLNQTNISQNNNKFYVIQLLKPSNKNSLYLWTRWGRVGEEGASELKGPSTDYDKSIVMFEKKFKDKTKNDWNQRDSFKPYAGKYTLLEMGDDEEDVVDMAANVVKKAISNKLQGNCKLDEATQYLISLIFNDDTFKDAMADLNIDTKKMPLGKLSKVQIAKGFDALLALEDAIKKNQGQATLAKLTSDFYTLIPHNFGRQRPPVIDQLSVIRSKKDMLIVLSDIELAQSMQKQKTSSDEFIHPIEEKYDLLNCSLTPVSPKENEFKIIDNYTKQTGKVKIKHIWRVERMGEGDRFKSWDKTQNRRLLWHGTNIAVVAAILKTGLRIMPHSGGRVGRGIYFASENAKSAGYVGYTSKREGVMFLNEVVLGKEYHITRDNSSLTSPPKGYDSVIAKGSTEPDPSQDVVLKIEKKAVTVPQGKPVKQIDDTHFGQSEYLVYKENQARIRYLLLIHI